MFYHNFLEDSVMKRTNDPNRARLCRRIAQLLVLASLMGVQAVHAQFIQSSNDNSSGDPNVIVTNPSNFETRNMVGVDDTADFYRFEITSRRSVQVQLTELTGASKTSNIGKRKLRRTMM